ncbi:hypothetical protein SAMN05414139_04534 [Burkholderia sp. D7]|nr:hypothetical protein SAMN05414139_04534 [Burkholderia sp. D7]
MSDKVCKLTGKHGKFDRAHIIPAALTRPLEKGQAFIESGDGKWPPRRFSS